MTVSVELPKYKGCPEHLREQRAVSQFFQSRYVQWFKAKRQSTKRGPPCQFKKDTDLAKVCNGYPCQKVKFQKSMKSTILYLESEVTLIVDLGKLSIGSDFRVKKL